MIKISKEQFGYEAMKLAVFDQTKKGFKRLAKADYDNLELVWDDFNNRLALLYKGHFLPRQIRNKSKLEKFGDEQFEAKFFPNSEARKRRDEFYRQETEGFEDEL